MSAPGQIRAVAYLRSASGHPADQGTITRQQQGIAAYAAHHGLTIAETYIDRGQSGATLNRPALSRLLADVAAGRVGLVVAMDAARLSRREDEYRRLLGRLAEYDVRLAFVSEPTSGWAA